MEAVAPDRRLAGRYILEEPIASGGMATVWRARDEVLARLVAVKILRDDLARDPDFHARFQEEAIAAAALTHPRVTSVYDTGIDDGACYIVLEYFDGRSLADILLEHGPMEPELAVGLMLPVLAALGAAHEAGLIHRDVKPGNVLVADDGRVKVTDFGIAKAAFAGLDLTATGAALGTVRYLSPEQVAGADVDARSDLYSAGVVLYELLTGRPPFHAETETATALIRLSRDPPRLRDIRPGVPRRLEEVVLRAMSRRPEDRYASADAMRGALERVVGERTDPRGIPAIVAARAPARPGSTFRAWMLAPLILILLAVAAVAGGLAIGRLQLGGPLGVRPAPDRTPSVRPARGGPVRIQEISDYDPQGDGSEHPEEVRAAIDGDPSTRWSTDHYNSAEFGGLKEGVGLWISFGADVRVEQVSIESPLPGWRFQLRAGSDPEDATDPVRATDGSTTFTANASGPTVVAFDPTETTGLLIWVTRLARADGRFAAAIGEVLVTGAG